MFIKIMKGDDYADANCDKQYRLIEASSFTFHTGSDWAEGGEAVDCPYDPCVVFYDKNGQRGVARIPGNVYVLNDQGKTIETWAPHSGRSASQMRIAVNGDTKRAG